MLKHCGCWLGRPPALRYGHVSRLSFVAAGLCASTLLGCSSKSLSSSDETAPAPVPVDLTLVYTPTAKVPFSATALAFNPTIDGELWVSLRQFPSGMACTLTDSSGCDALPGVMAVISDATSQRADRE